jgi:hypothetical protein
MPLDKKLLGIYLNDHLAGSTMGRELCKRALGENRDNELGPFLETLLEQIVEDRETLRQMMRRLGVGEDRVKAVVPWFAERIGRLKLNGSLLGYSPLSRVVELEALSLGVEGKLALWRNLQTVEAAELEEFDLGELEGRALAQRSGLEEQRLEAARLAFTD